MDIPVLITGDFGPYLVRGHFQKVRAAKSTGQVGDAVAAKVSKLDVNLPS